MRTSVENVRSGREWDVYVGRPMPGHRDPRVRAGSVLGNPFKGERTQAVALYRKWFHDRLCHDESFRQAVRALRGKRIACWCSPLTCHAHVIAEYVNAEERAALSAQRDRLEAMRDAGCF